MSLMDRQAADIANRVWPDANDIRMTLIEQANTLQSLNVSLANLENRIRALEIARK